MHDELQHDFRSADRGRARRRNRRRRSLPAAFRRGHWPDPSGIARPSGHLLSRPAFDPGTASRLWPPVWRVADPRFRRARGGGSAHPRGPQGALRDTQFRWRVAHRCQLSRTAIARLGALRQTGDCAGFKEGEDPPGLVSNGGGVIPTYCNNTIVRQPKAETEALDKAMMREIGIKLAKGYLKSPPLSNGR